MKLLFSEQKSNYARYQYPYSIWAVPEAGEKPAQLFNAGFLPASRRLDRFYLCRHLRVDLAKFKPSSENRRILRKGEGVKMELIPRASFDYTAERRQAFKSYADIRFGQDIMSFERLDTLFASPVITHLLQFTDQSTGKEAGTATLYVETPELAYYYYGFYDLDHANQNLGMFMMTSAVNWFREQGFKHVYLGTCYSKRALYKIQFEGIQFFNGFRWSSDMEELKYILERDLGEVQEHLLEVEEYRAKFYGGELDRMASSGGFGVRLS